MRRVNGFGAAALAALFAASQGCADWDNPVALSELVPEAEFEIGAARVETFEEQEIHAQVMEGGVLLEMLQMQLEIEPVAGGLTRTVEMEPEGEEFAAHVTFFEAGEYHLHLEGMPEGHRLMREMGETEIDVHRLHALIGPYWVELELVPAPVMEGATAHIHLHVFDVQGDGTPGQEVAGLQIESEVHDPGGVETVLTVLEEQPGEYETEHTFGEAGIYELHVGIEVVGVLEEGEFHIPVLGEEALPDGDADTGGHTHGNS